ncbi:hypothetical protein E2C01_014251 [Portunus trituberculatus]|uniref:Uncharacterized protein n=1 Tax=Portunus trituberculatus TaxID=210409 RepID=A0A5B7DIP3_PORTR|nr:hypothetical protein [Portunus trituberculatus]
MFQNKCSLPTWCRRRGVALGKGTGGVPVVDVLQGLRKHAAQAQRRFTRSSWGSHGVTVSPGQRGGGEEIQLWFGRDSSQHFEQLNDSPGN